VKNLIIVLSMLASFGASAATRIVTTNYYCGNHTIKDVGVKQDGAKNWDVAYKVTTNGVVVFNGNSLDARSDMVGDKEEITYFLGFQWVSELTDNKEKDSYSDDNGASYHPCTSYSSVKVLN